ncbi:transport and golgi organization 6 isoform X2 [Rhodnius prolixus]
MEKLLKLKNNLICADEKEGLLSVNQIQTIKSSLQILISFGILAHLPTGIGISLEKRSTVDLKILPTSSSLQKAYSLNLVLRCIMCLKEEETLRRMLFSIHLGDCLAAIFQLMLNPEALKNDPVSKIYLEEQLAYLLGNSCQSVLVKELMLLNGNKECPPKLARALKMIMVERLEKDNGVLATCKAILDVAGDQNSPKQWKTLLLIAKLISTPHQNRKQIYRDKVYPQVFKLLSTNEMQYAQIAVLCVRSIHEVDPGVCEKYFIEKICKILTVSSTEEELNTFIEILHNCIGKPSSEQWSLPTSFFKSIYVNIFRLYCFVFNSVSHIKTKLRNIVLSILAKDMVYDDFVFGTVKIKFNFGENGGVFTEMSNEEMLTPWGDASEILLNLLEDSDDLKVNLFKAVLTSMDDGSLERKAVGATLLSELCSSPSVLKWIDEEPLSIVNFIKTLLEENSDNEIICLGLMVLSLLLNTEPRVTTRDWTVFDGLVEPLKLFKLKSENVELRVLADEIYCLILTRGVISIEASKAKKSVNIKRKQIDSYAQALIDVTDPLLPVRAHAIRELGKLILLKDTEALKNKDKILCLLKENLKSDDSYVYLSAVESLATLTGSYPDDVLIMLTEQFVHCKIPETRLKIGEVLMRVIRILGEMAVVYKNEIINALLFGCRDSDHLVRASSLSSLGELCRILTFRIHAFIIEIFECIKCIFETDKAMEPRRAAVMLLTLLLKGLGTDALNTLEPILVYIYRLLKYIYNYEKDDITRLHAQLAIEELNSSTIAFLCPRQDLKKHIFVLHPPT